MTGPERRDPKRIDRILGKIRKHWTKYPDLRLLQLLEDVTGPNCVPYYLEDSALEEMLDSNCFGKEKAK